jgi:hypothetical protein
MGDSAKLAIADAAEADFQTVSSAPARRRAPRHTPVDHQFSPRHVAGRVRGEEEHAVRAVLSLSGLPERHPGFGHFVGSIGALLPEETGNLVQIGVSITPG